MTDVSPVQRRFFDAAMEILADDGYGGLKLAPLCRRVGVTSGSFYHAFQGWQGFTDAFLAYWFDERTRRIAEQAAQVEDAEEQVEMLLEVGLSLPHASESAIRVWSGIDPQVRALQREVDRLRLETVTAAFRGVMDDDAAALQLAKTALYLVVGYEQAGDPADRDALEAALRRLPDEAQRFTRESAG